MSVVATWGKAAVAAVGNSHSSLLLWASVSAVSALVFFKIFGPKVNALLRFVWHCFLRPIGGVDQKARLDEVSLITFKSDHPSSSGSLNIVVVLLWAGGCVRHDTHRPTPWSSHYVEPERSPSADGSRQESE